MNLMVPTHGTAGIPRITTSGIIRSGIMVPTAAAKAIPGLEDRYNAGVLAGASWDAIAGKIKKEFNLEKAPLRPVNAPYFSARASDFPSPATADVIMDMYGEDRGEGRHLYEVPVIFPSDNLLAVVPHSLKCFTGAGLKYWSEFDGDGERRCKMYAPVQKGRRPFGGRPRVDRDRNDGLCDPNECPEYQASPQQCKLTGALVFYIEGIPGSAVELRTSSYYGLSSMMSQLSEMMEMRGGIAGTYRGRALFRLVKRQETVSMLDVSTGQPKRVKQWIPKIEKTVDVSALFASAEQAGSLPSAPSAAALLEGPGRMPEGENDPF